MDNLIEMIRNPITQSGNWLLSFTFVAAWASIYHVATKRWDTFSEFTRQTIRAWCLMSLALAIYFGWFAISRHTAPDGRVWNPIELEYRWIQVMLTSLLCAFGVAKFASLVLDAPEGSHWLMWAGLIAVSLAVGIY